MILESTISFKITMHIALLTFFAPCFIPNASADRGDGIGSFCGFLVIALAVLLYHSHSHSGSQLDHFTIVLSISITLAVNF